MKDHAVVVFGKDARQDPALFGVAFQQGGQVHFPFDGHVGEDGVALLEDRPGFEQPANGLAGAGVSFFAEGVTKDTAVFAQLGFDVCKGFGHEQYFTPGGHA